MSPSKTLRQFKCLTVVIALAAPWSVQAQLTLDQAELMALEADPAVIAAQARATALQDQAVADGQLPDPKLGIGVYNLPLDDFSYSREPTTQFRTKIQQAFPPGDTLHYQQQKTEWLGKAQQAQASLARLEIRRDVQQAFLELYYQRQAAQVVEQSRQLFQQLVEITRSQFSTGRVSQQDVLQAQLELSRLDDRATQIDEKADVQRSQLARWIGEAAWQPLASTFPSLPGVPDQGALQASLAAHPAIQAASAQVEANQQMVKAAREQYKPGWNLGVEYRKRFGDDPDGSDRADMMAAMVTVDLPLFTEKRQDRRVAASLQRTEAARQSREARLRDFERMLEMEYARWRRLGEQQMLYEQRLVKEADSNAQAALNAYQAGVTEFTSLMRARLTELDIKLQDLRVRVDRAKVKARLLFLAAGARDPGLPVAGAKP
jgi:outer membrane protein TolC